MASKCSAGFHQESRGIPQESRGIPQESRGTPQANINRDSETHKKSYDEFNPFRIARNKALNFQASNAETNPQWLTKCLELLLLERCKV